MIKKFKDRLFSDYLMPSRLKEYRRLLEKSLKLDYKHLSVIDFFHRLEAGKISKGGRYFIHRHDIDTDIRTAKKMFSIEKALGIKATYYFRLSTLDYALMKEISEYGSEASYHFEELASYCKMNHIKSKKEALENLDEIKSIFKNNVAMIEKESSIKIQSVASHGDFVNRELDIINNVVTNDLSLRRGLGIACETYDSTLMDSFDLYISDKPYPVYFSPISPFEALNEPDKNSIICMTSHPRQWETNWLVNTVDNISRLVEGMRW
jgi:hypothetical protein